MRKWGIVVKEKAQIQRRATGRGPDIQLLVSGSLVLRLGDWVLEVGCTCLLVLGGRPMIQAGIFGVGGKSTTYLVTR
jgi:hypothetical protein